MKASHLGPKEIQVVARLSYERATIITKAEFDKLFGELVLTRQIIYQLKKKGILKPIIKGVYYYSPLESGPAGSSINEFLIPPVLFPKGDYYVGYSTMFNYHGLTEQVFQTMHILNTSRQRQHEVGGLVLKLLKVSASRLYGLERLNLKGSEVIISDRERTLIDLIYFPGPVGGLKQALRIFSKASLSKKTNLKRLVQYAARFPSISTRKRIGFVLEKGGVALSDLKPLLKTIKNSSTPVTLYGTKSKKGVSNSTWRIIVDDT